MRSDIVIRAEHKTLKDKAGRPIEVIVFRKGDEIIGIINNDFVKYQDNAIELVADVRDIFPDGIPEEVTEEEFKKIKEKISWNAILW